MTTVVLHHGLWGFNSIQWGPYRLRHWNGIDRAIAAAGYPVLVTQVHPTAGTQHRAEQLKQQIIRHAKPPGQPRHRVVILAHSMGGIDARYMISRLGMADHVAALVTIGTAHWGTSYYEWVLRTFDCCGQLSWIRATLWDLNGLWQATRDFCHRFNDRVPDVPGVQYFSIAGLCPQKRVPPILMPSYSIVAEAEGQNDTRVALASARWGRFLGTWPVHHFHLINWPMHQLPGDSTEDITPRYLNLIKRLTDENVLDRNAENAPPHDGGHAGASHVPAGVVQGVIHAQSSSNHASLRPDRSDHPTDPATRRAHQPATPTPDLSSAAGRLDHH